ncbi:oligopeptide/dipeptide ABC transporter ATP-binding protein, partial [Serratia marcescens]|uniref:oligopeptide/dipeptide ABC transporter ATP-binding protein n=1 Tax=Serratia marcescens TaxID=615 RepID=UPI0034D27159
TKALLACTPHGAGHGARLVPIPGALPSPLNPPAGCRFHPRCGLAVAQCAATVPALETVGADHVARCFRWRELAS